MQHLTDRETIILKLLMENEGISVSQMSARLNVSSVTIRNDLNNLSDKGMIVRTHGGAVPVFNAGILRRQKTGTENKTRIAKAAAELINDGDSVIIGAGTTTALIGKYLVGKKDIHIVSDSTLLLHYARINPLIHLTIVGGEFRPSSESLVGPVALRELEEFHVDKAFVGTDGITLENGLTTHLVEGAEIIKRMAKQANETILLADSTKFGKKGFVRIIPVDHLSRIITDMEISGTIRKDLENSNLHIQCV